MLKTATFLSLFVLGLTTYAIETLWPKLFPIATTWTDTKALRLPEVNDRLAELIVLQSKPLSMHSGADCGVAQRELMDLMRERECLVAEFDDAIKHQQTQHNPLKLTGIVLATIGVIVWCGKRLRELRTSPTMDLGVEINS